MTQGQAEGQAEAIVPIEVFASNAEFRQVLADNSIGQTAFARMLVALGDPRDFGTILRQVQHACRRSGGRRVPMGLSLAVEVLRHQGALRAAGQALAAPIKEK